MTEFFEKLKMGIDTSISAISIQSKKIIEITRINTQIAILKDQKRAELEALGTEVVALYLENNLDSETAIQARCKAVIDLDNQIEQKRADLEIIISQDKAEPTPVKPTCSFCGADVDEIDRFCRKCGNKMIET